MEWIWRTRVVGPLAPYADGLRSELSRLGYTHWSAADRVWMMGHLSRWLNGESLSLYAVSGALFDTIFVAPPTRRGDAETQVGVDQS